MINEVLANATKDNEEFVEIMNTGKDDVNVTGWKLFNKKEGKPQKDADGDGGKEDNNANENVYEFGGSKCKNTSSIAAGSKLLLVKGEECSFTFDLKRRDSLTLQSSNGSLVDRVSWTKSDALSDISYGRLPDGEGQFNLSQMTPGEVNKALEAEEALLAEPKPKRRKPRTEPRSP